GGAIGGRGRPGDGGDVARLRPGVDQVPVSFTTAPRLSSQARTRPHAATTCRAQELYPPSFLPPEPVKDCPSEQDRERVSVIRWAGGARAAWFTSRANLIAENLCLRQQLVVLQRRT